MDNLVIRKYVNNDFNEVINLVKDNFNIGDNIKSLEDNLNSFGIVAIIDKKIVGYLRVDKLYNPFKKYYYYFKGGLDPWTPVVFNNWQEKKIVNKVQRYASAE